MVNKTMTPCPKSIDNAFEQFMKNKKQSSDLKQEDVFSFIYQDGKVVSVVLKDGSII